MLSTIVAAVKQTQGAAVPRTLSHASSANTSQHNFPIVITDPQRAWQWAAAVADVDASAASALAASVAALARADAQLAASQAQLLAVKDDVTVPNSVTLAEIQRVRVQLGSVTRQLAAANVVIESHEAAATSVAKQFERLVRTGEMKRLHSL